MTVDRLNRGQRLGLGLDPRFVTVGMDLTELGECGGNLWRALQLEQ
jgi:hypothetical protein